MKRIIIVTGGSKPGKRLLRRRISSASFVIAADKGAEWCIEAGIKPDLVVGDLDSIDEAVLDGMVSEGIKIRRFTPEKDFTDTQIALDIAIENKADEIEIIAGIGSRFDHSLANVHLLYRALRRDINARIITDEHEIFLIDRKTVIRNEKGNLISFLPLFEKAQNISLKGFSYAIDKMDMDLSFPIGISNVIKSDIATVEIGAGILIAIIARKPERA